MDKSKKQRLHDARNAAAQQRLEGVALPRGARRNLMNVANGTLDLQQAFESLAQRDQAGAQGAVSGPPKKAVRPKAKKKGGPVNRLKGLS